MSYKHFAGVIGDLEVVVLSTKPEKAIVSALRFSHLVPAVAGVQADQVRVVPCDRSAVRLLRVAARARGFADPQSIRAAQLRCDLLLSICEDCGAFHSVPVAQGSESVH